MGFKGKVFVAGSDDEVDPAAVSLAEATSIFSRITNYYATEQERDGETAVPSKMTAAERRATRCWVDSRGGFCYWDPYKKPAEGWTWEPANRVIYDQTRPSGADVNGTSPTVVLDPSGTVLPPGNRYIEISARADAVPITNAPLRDAYPRILVEGVGYSGSSQMFAPGVSAGVSVYHHDFVILNGTLDMRMQVFGVGGSGWLRFSNIQLTLIDRGPI